MSWRTSSEIAWAELGVGSFVPASGAGGLALGAWILHRGGMAADRIARRSVAFFLIKSSVNFVAVAALGTLMAVGLVGPHRSLLLTALPAALSIAVIALVLAVPAARARPRPGPGASRLRRGVAAARRALDRRHRGGRRDRALARSAVIAGAIGYWAWDNAVLWATFHAVGADVPRLDRADGLPHRAARRPAPAARRRGRDRRRADRHAHRLRRAGRAPRWRPCWPTASSSSGCR